MIIKSKTIRNVFTIFVVVEAVGALLCVMLGAFGANLVLFAYAIASLVSALVTWFTGAVLTTIVSHLEHLRGIDVNAPAPTGKVIS